MSEFLWMFVTHRFTSVGFFLSILNNENSCQPGTLQLFELKKILVAQKSSLIQPVANCLVDSGVMGICLFFSCEKPTLLSYRNYSYF